MPCVVSRATAAMIEPEQGIGTLVVVNVVVIQAVENKPSAVCTLGVYLAPSLIFDLTKLGNRY